MQKREFVDKKTLYERNINLAQELIDTEEDDVEQIINLFELNASLKLPTKLVKFIDIDK